MHSCATFTLIALRAALVAQHSKAIWSGAQAHTFLASFAKALAAIALAPLVPTFETQIGTASIASANHKDTTLATGPLRLRLEVVYTCFQGAHASVHNAA